MSRPKVVKELSDPVKACRIFWPQYTLYNKQREVLYSVRDNYETIVPAGHDMGKDFIAAMATLWFFISRRPCRVLTTSPTSGQLEDVLWGEIRRLIEESRYLLPLEYNHMHIYQISEGKRVPRCEIVGRVVKKDESMLGRHLERTALNEPTTLVIVDEASGVEDGPYEKADTWSHRKLVIGNPYKCSNFFFKGVTEGDLESKRSDTGAEKLYRKVIHIRGEDSPNVRLGLAQEKSGKEVTYENLIPGVLSYSDYLQRRETWDEIRQTVGIDGQFHRGAEILMYPPMWLDLSHSLHRQITTTDRVALGIGVDTAEGGDSTCWAGSDSLGLIRLLSVKTPDTSTIPGQTLAFMRQMGLNPKNKQDCQKVVFDRGGGGKQHADALRRQGYPVRTVGFGESATDESLQNQPGITTTEEKKKDREQKYVYFNKRAELGGRLRLRLDPSVPETQYAISDTETELRKQLAPIPLTYDREGRLKMLPKRANKANSSELTLEKLLGCSPDEFDAVGLSVYAMEVPSNIVIVGAI